MTNEPTTADRLLDAQVDFILAELSGARLDEVIDREVDAVLDVADGVRLDELVEPAEVTRIVGRLLTDVPAGVAASTLVQSGTDVLYDGPPEPVAAADLVAREHVEALVTEALALHPVAEQALDRLADSPLLGQLASRFVSRIVVEVVQANRSVAEKIPGMGGLFSMGTSAATKVMGAADKPLQQLVGGTAGKSAAFAVRRLNAVVIETLKDPLMHDAVMEVWDQHAAEPLDGLQRSVPREDVQRIAGLLHEIVIAGASAEPVQQIAGAFVDAFFAVYGEYPLTTLLEELEISRSQIKDELGIVVPRLVAAARADGTLEAAVRSRLAPFFHSPEVAAILQG